jgi:UDP-N-acetylmuramoyl-tripeptide--D-alanyl-D-alanine ligase
MTEAALAMGANTALQGEVCGYSIDSRTIAPGDLFFALRGENHDGHRFVAEVLSKALQRRWSTKIPSKTAG